MSEQNKPVLTKRPEDWDTYTPEQKTEFAKNLARQMGLAPATEGDPDAI